MGFTNKEKFSVKYCGAGFDRLGYWNDKGASNTDELNTLLHEYIMLRRAKSDVLKELPEKQRQVIELESCGASKAESKLLGKISGDLHDTLSEIRGKALLSGDHLMTIRRKTGLAKFKAACEQIDSYIEANEKISGILIYPDDEIPLTSTTYTYEIEAEFIETGITALVVDLVNLIEFDRFTNDDLIDGKRTATFENISGSTLIGWVNEDSTGGTFRNLVIYEGEYDTLPNKDDINKNLIITDNNINIQFSPIITKKFIPGNLFLVISLIKDNKRKDYNVRIGEIFKSLSYR
jgi:hypothetical protein